MGWKLGTQSDDFDADRGLETAELFAYIEDARPDEWAKARKTQVAMGDTAAANVSTRI